MEWWGGGVSSTAVSVLARRGTQDLDIQLVRGRLPGGGGRERDRVPTFSSPETQGEVAPLLLSILPRKPTSSHPLEEAHTQSRHVMTDPQLQHRVPIFPFSERPSLAGLLSSKENSYG